MGTVIGSVAALESIAEDARAYLDEKNRARERALARSREVIRSSANTIRAVHRHDFDRARVLIEEARAALVDARASVESFGDIRYAGFIHDAEKEFAEATTVLAVLGGEELPRPSDIGVEWPAYLNGLGEAVGELRRFLLDGLRRDDLTGSESLLRAMDEVYDVLVTMDYPDGITGGLRRTTDVTRGILEKTRGDLTVAMRQQSLEAHLRSLETRILRANSSEAT